MAVTRSAASALAARADLACAYRSCDIVVEPRQVLFGQLAHALLEALGAEGDFAVLSEVYAALPGTLFSALRETEDLNGSIATALADEVIIYVLAAGPNYGSGYALAMCSLMERQWKHAACFHAGEFLHGACEMLTPPSRRLSCSWERMPPGRSPSAPGASCGNTPRRPTASTAVS
ncbi:hypothetical protein [Streptomyces telluris]|uniref:SIS domain-containing protein n=1 Tax=Streptomyces telluris TaxID=2720021 RepID=A0A9X2RPD8_9ACTN|nr:hypothetical protein [Streptomyces telluris]MCQ8771346.1 hypothetical protein [Streptomyces telluris]NJP80668.1 hypothetical protein [Streptomyces telluris]